MEPSTSALLRSIMRFIGLLFGVSVLGIIAGKLSYKDSEANRRICYFNDVASACDFGLACGGLSIIAVVVFTVADCAARIELYTQSSIRRAFNVAGILVADILSILWLACFGHMTNEWLAYVHDVENNRPDTSFPPGVKSAGEASLAFSFLSVPVWVIIGVLDYKAFRSL